MTTVSIVTHIYIILIRVQNISYARIVYLYMYIVYVQIARIVKKNGLTHQYADFEIFKFSTPNI